MGIVIDKQTGEVFEYDDKQVKKLPDGTAYGANDLRIWSVRRADGKDGSHSQRELSKEKKRAKKLAELSGKPVKAFDGSIQSPSVKKKFKRRRAYTKYELYKQQRMKSLTNTKLKPTKNTNNEKPPWED